MKKKILVSISSLLCLSVASYQNSNAMDYIKNWLWSPAAAAPLAAPAAAAAAAGVGAPRTAPIFRKRGEMSRGMMAEIALLEEHRARVTKDIVEAAYARYKEKNPQG